MTTSSSQTNSLQQYVITAYDGQDSEALNRRLAVREAHLENARRLKAEGGFIQGGAILNESGQMIGSVMIVTFATATELNEWLQNDPYVTGNVWQNIQVQPFRCAKID
jgi:uncharacterized protein